MSEFYAITKSVVFYLFFPVSLSIELLLAGVLVFWLSDKRKLGGILVLCGTLLLILFSTFLLPDYLLKSLERKYPPLTDRELIRKYSDVPYIVVLGGGTRYSETLPVTSQLYPSSVVRITEGIRIFFKLNKKSKSVKLIVSGGGNFPITSAELMAMLSDDMGIRKDRIIVEKDSFTTYDEAVNIKPLVKETRFLLVTSAAHMPRSMALFRNAGMNPIAVPTDHWTDEREGHDWTLPSADNFKKAELAFYEYFGFVKEKLAGLSRG